MESDVIQDLNELINSFSKLNQTDKIIEISEKLKRMIGILSSINPKHELYLASLNTKDQLTYIYKLICCLEDEVGRILENI